MGVFKILVVNSIVFLSVFSFSATAHTGTVVMPGGACSSPNLQQALSGQMGQDQFGVTNNGTGSFFVVCPIPVEAGKSYASMEYHAQFPSGSGSMACVFRAINNEETVVFHIATATNNFNNASVDFTAISANSRPNMTVVCPLLSGEKLQWYFVEEEL